MLLSWIKKQSSEKEVNFKTSNGLSKMLTNLSLLFRQILMMDFHILELLLQGEQWNLQSQWNQNIILKIYP